MLVSDAAHGAVCEDWLICVARKFTLVASRSRSLFLANCYANRVPDLSISEAASIISRAPEFNGYARLISVKSIYNQTGSMQGVCFGEFTFSYSNSPVGAPVIDARVDFRYHGGKWYLNQFNYNCPHDCHIVDVFDGPAKHAPSVRSLETSR